MNLQERSDRRSLSLHREIVKKLQSDESLWDVPLRNIERWTETCGGLPTPYRVWRDILTTEPHENIIKILLSKSQRSQQLRSSTPFTGIIDQETRKKVFDRYRIM